MTRLSRTDPTALLLLAWALPMCHGLPCNEADIMPAAGCEPDSAPEPIDAEPDASCDADDHPSDGEFDLAVDSEPESTPEPIDAEDRLDDPAGVVRLRVTGMSDGPLTYRFETTAARRDNQPDNPRVVAEQPGYPRVRTSNFFFDGLYALALAEMDENAVESVVDGAYYGGEPVPCRCFETGRQWTWVWTRDIAYSVDLALGTLDPSRSLESLRFKLSSRHDGGGLHIVQDTGTGGSWPVSTDRVVWARGAERLLHHLDAEPRAAFESTVHQVLAQAIEQDRAVAFDPIDGLYRGEQSFLDWREQSYPRWAGEDVTHIALSKSLSTNLAHLRALKLGAQLAQRVEDARAAAWEAWACDLRETIRTRLLHPNGDRLSTFITTALDPTPVAGQDLLGSALAILDNVVTRDEARAIVSQYPHTVMGPPVIWPQQPDTPIYHNRALWPFVTAYWLLAARHARHAAAFDHALHSLMRGAALNLSNMENLEMVTGEASGPVINSQRQLWSVAGYLAAVQQGVFGLETGHDGLRFQPFVTRQMRHDLFGDTDQITLKDLPYHGRHITVVVHLPSRDATETPGAYAVGEVQLDGEWVATPFVNIDRLSDASRFDVHLIEDGDESPPLTIELRTDDPRRIFAPPSPDLDPVSTDAQTVELTWTSPRTDVVFDIFRDGETVAQGLAGDTTTWRDPDADQRPGRCYTLRARDVDTGLASAHAEPQCAWYDGVDVIPANLFELDGGEIVESRGRWHTQDWGDPDHRLRVNYTARRTGPHLLQLDFANGASVETGVTCAIKRVAIRVGDNPFLPHGYFVLPHTGGWGIWRDGSFVPVHFEAGRTYTIELTEDPLTGNMSNLDHFATYLGPDGRTGPFTRVDVAALKVLAREGSGAYDTLGMIGTPDIRRTSFHHDGLMNP